MDLAISVIGLVCTLVTTYIAVRGDLRTRAPAAVPAIGDAGRIPADGGESPRNTVRLHLIFWPVFTIIWILGTILNLYLNDLYEPLSEVATATIGQIFVANSLTWVSHTLPFIIAAGCAALLAQVGKRPIRLAGYLAFAATVMDLLVIPAVQRMSGTAYGGAVLYVGVIWISLLAAAWLALRGSRGSQLWFGAAAGAALWLIVNTVLPPVIDSVVDTSTGDWRANFFLIAAIFAVAELLAAVVGVWSGRVAARLLARPLR